jgi:hypothetical protein
MAAGFKPQRQWPGEVGVNRERSYPLVCGGTPPLAALRTTNQRAKRDKVRCFNRLTAAAGTPRPQTPFTRGAAIAATRGSVGATGKSRDTPCGKLGSALVRRAPRPAWRRPVAWRRRSRRRGGGGGADRVAGGQNRSHCPAERRATGEARRAAISRLKGRRGDQGRPANRRTAAHASRPARSGRQEAADHAASRRDGCSRRSGISTTRSATTSGARASTIWDGNFPRPSSAANAARAAGEVVLCPDSAGCSGKDAKAHAAAECAARGDLDSAPSPFCFRIAADGRAPRRFATRRRRGRWPAGDRMPCR